MNVRLYDYDVPAADSGAGVASLRPLLEALDTDERRALLTGLFKPERMPGHHGAPDDPGRGCRRQLRERRSSRSTTRPARGDSSRSTRPRPSWTDGSRRPPSSGVREWDVARLLEPYGDGTFHGKLLKRTRKQLRSVSSREALTVPFLFRRSWSAS